MGKSRDNKFTVADRVAAMMRRCDEVRRQVEQANEDLSTRAEGVNIFTDDLADRIRTFVNSGITGAKKEKEILNIKSKISQLRKSAGNVLKKQQEKGQDTSEIAQEMKNLALMSDLISVYEGQKKESPANAGGPARDILDLKKKLEEIVEEDVCNDIDSLEAVIDESNELLVWGCPR